MEHATLVTPRAGNVLVPAAGWGRGLKAAQVARSDNLGGIPRGARALVLEILASLLLTQPEVGVGVDFIPPKGSKGARV